MADTLPEFESRDDSITSTITALNGAVTLALRGAGTVSVETQGIWNATLVVEILVDPTSTFWTPVRFNPYSGGISVGSTTINGRWYIPVSGATFIRVRASVFTSGTVTAYIGYAQGGGATFITQGNGNNCVVAAIQSGVWNVSLFDATRRTYSASAIFGAANNATDIFTISGSATTLVRVIRLSVSATKTSAGTGDVILLKRSTANTGGTSVSGTKVSHDSADAAATNTVLSYTVNPTTLGTLVGNMQVDSLHFVGTSKMTSQHTVEWDWTASQGKAPVLRGVNELLCVNLAGGTFAGNSMHIDVTWSEE